MTYSTQDIGSFIQLKKGQRIHLKHISSEFSGLVMWENIKTGGELKFDTPALLCSINDGYLNVRLPFSDPGSEFSVEV